MRLYLTEYRIGEEKYAAQFLASDEQKAEHIATERGLGEVIVGSQELNQILDRERYLKLLHSICYMGFIALKSGKATAEEILSDRGILHEAIHLADGSYDEKTLSNFNEKLGRLRDITHSAPLIAV